MNPNDIVRIKPTESGWKSIIRYVDARNDEIRKRYHDTRYRWQIPVEDKDGYITGQFWCLMQYFDWQNPAGSECPFYDMQCCDEVAALRAEIQQLKDGIEDANMERNLEDR